MRDCEEFGLLSYYGLRQLFRLHANDAGMQVGIIGGSRVNLRFFLEFVNYEMLLVLVSLLFLLTIVFFTLLTFSKPAPTTPLPATPPPVSSVAAAPLTNDENRSPSSTATPISTTPSQQHAAAQQQQAQQPLPPQQQQAIGTPLKTEVLGILILPLCLNNLRSLCRNSH